MGIVSSGADLVGNESFHPAGMADVRFGSNGACCNRDRDSSGHCDGESLRRERSAVRRDRRSCRTVDHAFVGSGRMENAAGGLYTFPGLRYCEAASGAAIGKIAVGLGIVLDDVAAGCCALAMMQLLLHLGILSS